MTDADAVTVSIEVGVPPATAFEAFTEEMDAWWGRGPRFRFVAPYEGVMKLEPGVGGRLLHVYDEAADKVFVVGHVRVWQPPERLVVSWRLTNFAPHEETEVDVRFVPSGAGTRVSVTHRGWDGLPAGHPARHGLADHPFVLMRGHWWADMLTSAKRHMTGGGV